MKKNQPTIKKKSTSHECRTRIGSLICVRLNYGLSVDSIGSWDSYAWIKKPSFRRVLHNSGFVDFACRTGFVVAAKTKVRRYLAGNRHDTLFLTAPADQALVFFTVSPPPAVTCKWIHFDLLGHRIHTIWTSIYAEKQTQNTNLSQEPNE